MFIVARFSGDLNAMNSEGVNHKILEHPIILSCDKKISAAAFKSWLSSQLGIDSQRLQLAKVRVETLRDDDFLRKKFSWNPTVSLIYQIGSKL